MAREMQGGGLASHCLLSAMCYTLSYVLAASCRYPVIHHTTVALMRLSDTL